MVSQLQQMVFSAGGSYPITLAQGGGESSLSWFQMFLYSGDWFGLLIIWLLVVLSVASIGFALQLTLRCRRVEMLPEGVFKEVDGLLDQKLYQDAINRVQRESSYLAKLIAGALCEANNGHAAMVRSLEEVSDAEATKMLRPIEYLNVVGNVAPMVGLFGTVYGMIRAFQTLVESGGTPDAGKLAAGISTALVTTFWGLIVAIPALTFYALIRNKIDAQATEGIVMVERLLSPFKPQSGHGPYISAGSANAGHGVMPASGSGEVVLPEQEIPQPPETVE